jgi:hypothetical protein
MVVIVFASVNQTVNYTTIALFFKTIVSKKVNALINIFLQKKTPSWNRKFLFLLVIFPPRLFWWYYEFRLPDEPRTIFVFFMSAFGGYFFSNGFYP